MFAVKYEFFLVDDEFKYDVFEFDDLCSTDNYLIVFASASETISPPSSLKLKLLLNSLKCLFLGLDESLPIIIAFDLD